WKSARDHFEKALQIFQANSQAALTSRALNDLGLMAFESGDLDSAEARFRTALEPGHQVVLRPLERYSLLCNLASVLHRRGKTEESFRALREAVAVSEEPRGMTTGAEEGRALFLSQFSEAFELLLEWSLSERRLDEAFNAIERSRNRTFL